MSRALLLGAVACSLLSACDDGTLRAFEPISVLGGAGGTGPDARGGATPTDSKAGSDTTGAGSDTTGAAGSDTGVPSSALVIDDFEDGDIRAKALGWWYPVNDGTGTQGFGIEPVSTSTTSVYALQTHGSGFRSWGAAVGVDLTLEATPLSALGYQQLCFSAKVEPGASTLIQVHFLKGGLHYTQDVTVSETWTRYCRPLVDFMSVDGALVPSDLTALQFFFTPNAPFGFWLDDVELTP